MTRIGSTMSTSTRSSQESSTSCIDHDRPIVADIVWKKNCKVVKAACQVCIDHFEDRRRMEYPDAKKQAVQYRIPTL